jgi:transcriptional regulator with XRE-family HTH domain
LTQTDVAARAGMSRDYVASIEGGRIVNPGAQALYALAQALGVTMELLMGRPFLAMAAVRRVSDDGYTFMDAQAEIEARLPLVGVVPFEPLTGEQMQALAPGFDAAGAMEAATNTARRFVAQSLNVQADWAAASFYMSGAIATWLVVQNSANYPL